MEELKNWLIILALLIIGVIVLWVGNKLEKRRKPKVEPKSEKPKRSRRK